jgi:hypothetical protein
MKPNVICTMREVLRRKGTSPLVRLDLNNHFFNETFVQQCVDELESKSRLSAAGLHTLTPLERLALHLLSDSAGIGH